MFISVLGYAYGYSGFEAITACPDATGKVCFYLKKIIGHRSREQILLAKGPNSIIHVALRFITKNTPATALTVQNTPYTYVYKTWSKDEAKLVARDNCK